MQPLDLILLAIATWRLSFLMTNEAGPFGLMARFRARTTIGGLLACIKCTSVWAALLLLLIYFTPLVVVVWLFAVSGLALMLASYTGAGVNHD